MVSTVLGSSYPPDITPLVDDEVPFVILLAALKLPKSCEFPVDKGLAGQSRGLCGASYFLVTSWLVLGISGGIRRQVGSLRHAVIRWRDQPSHWNRIAAANPFQSVVVQCPTGHKAVERPVW